MNAQAVKTALARMVKRLGGVEAAASIDGVRVGKSAIGGYYSHGTQHADDHATVDVVMALEAELGEPLVTAQMALAAGYRLVPVTMRGEGELAEALARVGQRSGEVFACAAAALADGVLDDRERADLVLQLRELERAAGEAAALLTPRPPRAVEAA